MFAVAPGGGCRRALPAVDVAARPSAARGTLTGIIRGREGALPVIGRAVQIVNVDTGARHMAQTGEAGRFTIQLPAGKYRIDVPLHEGETVVKRPGIVNLDTDAADSRIEVVLASLRVSRPRGPAYRLDNGLGSPIT